MTSPLIWSLLVLTLPTENATARMRHWRALKARGCAVLRDGIYLLPYSPKREDMLRELAASIVASGGTPHLLRAPSFDAEQESYFRTLFDRSDDYASFMRTLADARKAVSGQSPADLARLQRRLRKDYESVVTTDYFPSEAATRAESAWQDFISHVQTVLSPGEPHAAERPIALLRIGDYQGRTWATRRRLWVDRVASAWLVRRFVDRDARFLWLESPAQCPADVLGFDFDGATFTHVGERVTFEVLLASFGLDQDVALLRLGQMVHALDVGGEPVPEAAGFEAVLAGPRERVPDDDRLLAETTPVLDALYAYFAATAKNGDGRARR
ncbi:chromate resistance protein ChrB domain-containing protein [Paraburkholderia graminis]|uniref:chromate resistance protein ChrB domain-containing protein n=1 Tax=Paraburkholderia graminis TaxID=60548 RepID=UPI0038B77D68